MQKQHDGHAGDGSFKLVGYVNFLRTNPKSDIFQVKQFHHVEFWCSDINILFTAPYSPSVAEILMQTTINTASIPTFNHSTARSFSTSHGLGVRAIALEVDDAEFAFNISTSYGDRPSHPPMEINDGIIISEIQLYGDVVLRYISFKNSNLGLNFLPGFKGMDDEEPRASKDQEDFGIRRLDHVARNVFNIAQVIDYVKMFSGFHEFAQLAIDDLVLSYVCVFIKYLISDFLHDLTGLVESGWNTGVLANNGESVLLNITEPVHGTEIKSQIQTYLEHNQGERVGHIALASKHIFTTLKKMKRRSLYGLEFMPPPP
ncbi:hypothetical protein MKX03_024844, partial [Papaver bracteatum]